MKDILVRSGLCGVVMLGMFSCAVSIQANDEDNARVSIQGRDVFLDGRPHIPHGMVHAANEHFPSLSKIGINSIHEDVAFRDFDPRRSDEENKAALARYLKKADEAHANGMTMLWLFSFHYTPDWLWERYPDAHAKKQDGSDGQGGVDFHVSGPSRVSDRRSRMVEVCRIKPRVASSYTGLFALERSSPDQRDLL